MKELNKPGENMGGLLRIWAVPPSVITVGINGAAISSTADVIAIYCTPGTIGFTEKTGKDESGTFYNAELVAKTPKDSEDALDIIEQLAGRRWVVIYLDQNEQYKVVGTEDNGLRFSVDLDTGKDTPNYNGHELKFYGKQENKARFTDNPFSS